MIERHGRTWKRPTWACKAVGRTAENSNDKRRDKRQEGLNCRIKLWEEQDSKFREKEYTKPGALK